VTAAPTRIPSSGGEVIFASDRDREAYDAFRFATARRAGDTLYVSGVIAARLAGEGNDEAAFKDQVRRAFRAIGRTLAAADAGFADVTMINTFHIFDTPDFAGSKVEQFRAFGAVKDEFMSPPHPAWTAVGTTDLLLDGGIVEIQMIAHIPSR